MLTDEGEGAMPEIVFKIIQKALAGDIANVKEYSLLLADQLEESGEDLQAGLLRRSVHGELQGIIKNA